MRSQRISPELLCLVWLFSYLKTRLFFGFFNFELFKNTGESLCVVFLIVRCGRVSCWLSLSLSCSRRYRLSNILLLCFFLLLGCVFRGRQFLCLTNEKMGRNFSPATTNKTREHNFHQIDNDLMNM